MAAKTIFKICDNCEGGKKVMASINHNGDPLILGPELEEIDCPVCEGSGYVEWGYLE